MTVPSTEPIAFRGPSVTYQAVQATIRLANKIKVGCDDYVFRLAQPIEASLILDVLNRMSKAVVNLADYKATPEFDEVARKAIPGYAGSLSADIQATINAMQNTANWVIANVPKDASGWVLVYKWNADGTVTDRVFQPAQTVGLVTALQSISATIG